MYDFYYTASDVTVNFHYPVTNKTVNIDQCISIGFRHTMSSMPVYTLGNISPVFFSRGNSLVQGQLDLAFKSNAYMQTALNYLINQDSLDNAGQALKTKFLEHEKNKKKPALTPEEYSELSAFLLSPSITSSKKSISTMNYLFDIEITFNNSNSTRESNSKVIKIKGVKISEQSISVMSHDEGTLVDRYTFMAKNIE